MKKEQIKQTIIIILLVVLAILLIGTGIYFINLANSNKVIYNYLSLEKNQITDLLQNNYNYNYDDKYTINYNINSSYSTETTTTNEFINKLSKIFNNLSKLNTEITISEDKTTNKALIKVNSTKDLNEYINIKYYIKDSTGFYYNKAISNNYINIGNNNFFETINKDTSTKDNINTINSIIIKSLSKELENKYLTKDKTSIEYNNKNINVNKYTIKLSNKDINKLLRLILKDLKENNKSKTILKNYINDFENLKLKDNIEFIKENEYITINIYSTKYKNDILKSDIIYTIKDINYQLTQEFISNKENIYYLENNNMKYKFIITKNDNSYTMDILNNKNIKIGKGTLTKNNREEILDINITDLNNRIYIDYTSNNKNNNIKSMYEFKYIENNKNVLTYTLNVNRTFSKKVKILEDTTNSILKSSLNESQLEQYNNYFNNLKTDIIGE